MGVGYGLYAIANSYVALIVVAVIGSIGFHNWAPMQSALGMELTDRARSGRALGFLSSMGSLAAIVGMGLSAIVGINSVTAHLLRHRWSADDRWGYPRFPDTIKIGDHKHEQPRMFLSKRYWLYYVLNVFRGIAHAGIWRFQHPGSCPRIRLERSKNKSVSLLALSLIYPCSAFGASTGCAGERVTLSASYVALALCFIGYATVHNVWFLSAMLICINLMVTLRIGLSTYVNRIAPPDEVHPNTHCRSQHQPHYFGLDVVSRRHPVEYCRV